MKIIAVNISVNKRKGFSDRNAVSRAWKLNRSRTLTYKYVIGVISGGIHGYYIRVQTYIDKREPNRVAFKLKKCSIPEEKAIIKYIAKANLRHFVTKYID